MFEQSLFNQEPQEKLESHEGDLFHDYEIKNWDLSPQLYKIIGISAAVNILAILIVGQTSLLTMKGCDSPLVSRVCQVIDTVYMGSLLFGTDREYVDAAYEKTDLADADITFVDVTGETPPLTYPEGYFAIANPEQYQAMLAQANDPMAAFSNPGIITTPDSRNSLLNTVPITPQPNPNAVTGENPTSPFSNVPSAAARKNSRGRRIKQPPLNNDSPDKLPDFGGETANANANTAGEKTIASDTVPEVEINKKPLLDFADAVLTKWLNKEVDLDQPFTVVLDATLTKDGKFDKAKTRWDSKKQKGDPKMIAVVREALEAVGDSGFMSYLRDLDVEKATITLIQDDKQVTAVISSDRKTVEQARTLSSRLRNAITIGKTILKNPSDERTLLDGVTVTSEGANFVVNFVIPKPVAQEMRTRKLNEARVKRQQGQPSGEATSRPNDNTARR